MNVILNRVQNESEIKRVAALADEIWHQHYSNILSANQIDYMLDRFQSFPTIKNQMAQEGYEYYLITINQEEAGYTAIKNDKKKLFLSKLYIRQENRGKGYASQVMRQLKDLASSRGLSSLWLTVNRSNLDSIAIYKKLGLGIVKELVSDIGEGYVMDDYVMEVEV